MKEIAILGAGGLTGRELIRILRNHPEFKVTHITSSQMAGKTLSEAYPSDVYSEELVFKTHDSPLSSGITIGLATPNEASLNLAVQFKNAGHKVIDLSGTFRLHNKTIFEKVYKFPHTQWDSMDSVVFGLPEFYRDEIKNHNFVSNPGCYATASLVPIRILRDHWGDSFFENILSPIIIDAKSGVSGAGGRTEDVGFSFTNTYENFRAYKILSHQHEPEIREYGMGEEYTDKEDSLVFTPHLLPVYRGILATIYINWKSQKHAEMVSDILRSKCDKEPFLRYRSTPEEIELKNVQMTNFFDISAKARNNMSIIVTAIDNLGKGAASQALQNLNLMHGMNETLGLL